MINWRHQYDDETDEKIGNATATENTEESMTMQSFTDEVNLNVIVRRFGITDGAIPPAPMSPAYYGDFRDVPDFRQALDNMREAAERFNALPADLRRRFDNDPLELFTWINNPKNLDEAVTLGLLNKAAVAATTGIATPPASTSAAPSPGGTAASADSTK